eukprot:XP_025007906.1 maestro heat-like repeat-containing protein family member 2B [Gallus gallus]
MTEHMCASSVCLGHAISAVLALLSSAAHRGFPSKGKVLSPLPADHTCASATHPTLWGWRSVPPRAGQMLSPGSKQHQRQLLCSFLPGLLAGVGCVPRRTRRRERGRVASPVPPCAVTLLLQRLQDQEGDRAQAYCELEHVLWEGDSRPPCGVLNRLLAEVSQDLTAAQVRGRSQRQREPPARAGALLADSSGLALPREGLRQSPVPRVTSDSFSGRAGQREDGSQQCPGGSGQDTLHLGDGRAPGPPEGRGGDVEGVCARHPEQAVQQLRSTVHLLCVADAGRPAQCGGLGERRPDPAHCLCCCETMVRQSQGSLGLWPAMEKKQICENLHQLFCSVLRNWQDCQEEKDKQAVLEAEATMMAVLLQEALHREHVWEQLLWLVHPYQEVQDTCRGTKSLTIFLEALEGVQSVIPKDKFLAITSAMFYQLSDDTKEHSEADRAELAHCILLQARICPEETVLFLQSQLGADREAGCVAALGLLGALARSDEPVMSKKLPQVVEAVQCLCSDPRTQVRRAILHFIKDVLSANTRSCSAWDEVGHIFSEFSRTTGRRAAGDLSAQEAREEGALQELCMDILGSLDLSVRGMTKLLWPRLLLYVVPAQYTGMLIPVSRCVQALAERGDLMVREVEELDAHFLSSMFQGPLLTPQTLLARLLVVAGSPFAGSELQAAALLLMQNLHSRIHRAVGAMWAAEIPLLLQCLQGKDESFPDSAEWECCLLKVQHCQEVWYREVLACLKEPCSLQATAGQEQPLKHCCGVAARLCGTASSSLSQPQEGS